MKQYAIVVALFFFAQIIFAVPVPDELKGGSSTGIDESTLEKVTPEEKKKPSGPTIGMRKVRDIEKIPPVSAAAPMPETGLHGKHKSVVIMIEFTDRKFPKDRTVEYYQNLLFGKRGNTMHNFYKENSYGKYDIDGQVYGVYQIPYSVAQFHYKPGMTYAKNRMKVLIQEIVKRTRGKVPYSQFDLYNQAGDKKPDGLVDHFGIIYPGTFEDIWPHRYGGGSDYATVDGVRINGYYIQNTSSPLGTIVHEFGHDIGLPDLYDTDYSSYGIGMWGCMAGGSWADRGRTPVHLSAWAKIKLGWIQPKLVTKSGKFKVKNSTRSPYALKIPVGSVASKEYFLVENREKWGFDKFLPQAGIIIWHVNENQNSNRDEQRKLLDVIEAAPDRDLDKPFRRHRPVYTHTFMKSGVNKIDDSTVPSTRLSNGQPSGIRIQILSDPGDSMTVKIKRPKIANPGGPVITLDNDHYKMGRFYYQLYGKKIEPMVMFKAKKPAIFGISVGLYYAGNSQNRDMFRLKIYKGERSGSSYVPGKTVYQSKWIRPELSTSQRYMIFNHEIKNQNGIKPGDIFFVSYTSSSNRPSLGIIFTRPGSGHSYMQQGNNVTPIPENNYVIRVLAAVKSKQGLTELATQNDRVVQKMFKAQNYRDKKRYKQAFLMYKDVLQKMAKEKFKYQEWIPVAVTGLGVLAYRLKYYDDALYAFKIGLEMADYAGAKKQVAILNENLGETYFHKQDYENAKAHLEKSLALKQELNIGGELLTESYVWLGRTYAAMGKKDEAKEFLNKGLEMARNSGDSEHTEMAQAALQELGN